MLNFEGVVDVPNWYAVWSVCLALSWKSNLYPHMISKFLPPQKKTRQNFQTKNPPMQP